MMIRTVLAVALAAALLAVSQPAIQQAGRERTVTNVADEAERFLERADHLVATDDAVARPGARRIVSVRLPEDRRFAAGVDMLSFEPGTGSGDSEGAGDDSEAADDASRVAWVIEGGDRHERVVEDVSLETSDGEPLRLVEPGRHRLVLSLRGSSANPAVHVRRFAPGGGDGA